MWREYSKEKPTNKEHEYLVKKVKIDGMFKGDESFHLLGYSNNLSEVDKFAFWGRTDGGFVDCDSEYGYFAVEENKFDKLYWVDLTELNLQWSNKEWSKNV